MALSRQLSMGYSTLSYLEGMLTPVDESTNPVMPLERPEIDPGHANAMLKKMRTCFEDEKFCDVTLLVGDRGIKAHKLVLSSFSLYFAGLFGDNWIDSRQDQIDMSQFDEAALKSVLDFGYSGHLHLDTSVVLKVLHAADFLQLFELEVVKESCVNYLKDCVNNENCSAMLVFAEQFHADTLKEILMKYAAQNFYHVGASEDFIKLPVDLLVPILKSESLVVDFGQDFLPPVADQEKYVLDIVLKYVTYQCGGNAESDSILCKLVQYVRLLLLSPTSLEGLRSYAENSSCYGALKLIAKANDGNLDNSKLDNYEDKMLWKQTREAAVQSDRCWRTYANKVYVGMTQSTFGEESFTLHPDLYIKGMKIWIRLWDGRRVIGGLQVFYSNGESPFYGGDDEDSDVHEFHLEKQERIVKTEINAGWMIDHLKFFTNKGIEHGPYGGPGGASYMEQSHSKYGFLSYMKGAVVDTQDKLAITKLQLIWKAYLVGQQNNYITEYVDNSCSSDSS